MAFRMLQSLWLTLCLCLTAALASAAPYAGPHGYSVFIPPGWHQTPPLPGDDTEIVVNQKVMVGRSPTSAALSIRFQPVHARITPANLPAFSQGVESSLRQQFPDFKVISQTRSTLGGIPDLDSVFAATINGVPMRFHEVLVARPGAAAMFTTLCPVQTLPKYAGVLAQMLASVRWKS